MSLESRLQKLEQALAARQPPRVIKVQLIVVHSRAELDALEKLRAEHPEPPRPPAPGRVKLELLLPAITAAEVLRAAGIEVPITEAEETGPRP